MLDKKLTMDQIVVWCQQQVTDLPTIRDWNRITGEWEDNQTPNTVETELQNVLRNWYRQNFYDYDRRELRDLVMDWIEHGTVGIKTMNRQQLLDTMWEDLIEPWAEEAENDQDGPLTVEGLLADTDLFVTGINRTNPTETP